MKALHFKWLGRPTSTRSKNGTGGAALDTGHIYPVAAFAAEVLAEWIATGFAEAVEVKATDTVLDVKSATVKAKAPKLGAEL